MRIAWGASKLLEVYIKNTPSHDFEFIVDSFYRGDSFSDLPVKTPSEIVSWDHQVVIFAVSTEAVQSILQELAQRGMLLGQQVSLYSDICLQTYTDRLRGFGIESSPQLYALAKSFSLTTKVPTHTTILGNLLFLDILTKTRGAIAEVGSFCGGNALLAAQYMLITEPRPFYIMDSFEGFPQLSKNDPSQKKQGDYKTTLSYEDVLNNFASFPFSQVIKGFVPDSFLKLPQDEKYGLVFYDCDLYQPALDTFGYFWDKILPGGFILIHDYITDTDGFFGVQKATHEFFKDITPTVFWENTMAVVQKPQ